MADPAVGTQIGTDSAASAARVSATDLAGDPRSNFYAERDLVARMSDVEGARARWLISKTAASWEPITEPVGSRLQTWRSLARPPGALVDFDVNLPIEDLSNRVQDMPPSRHLGGTR